MPFWSKNNEARMRREESVRALEAGDIPLVAKERLEREKHMSKGFFTSSLSTQEYLLTREAGYEIIGQVMGTAFFNVNWAGFYSQGSHCNSTGELPDITSAQIEAR